MKEYIIAIPDNEPLSSLRRPGKTITAIAKIVGNCDEVIRCRDCKHRMHDKTCIKVMKRKPDDGFCDEGEVKQY